MESVEVSFPRAFPEHNIPVVLASSDYYVPYMATTVQSVIQTAGAGNNYDIIILHQRISEEEQRKVQGMAKDHPNISIRFLAPNEEILKTDFNYREDSAAASESFYCVVLMELLPAYEKVFVMDCDVIVRHDVAELYAVDLEGYMIAASRDPDGIGNAYADAAHKKQGTIMQGRAAYMLETMGLKRLDDYFQSGVMLLNLAEFRKQYTLAQILEVACADYIMFGDQDTMNILCKDRVRYVDMSWNFIINYHNIQLHALEGYGPQRLLDEYKEARKKPNIIHYAGIKPWDVCDVEFSQYFWENAAQTPYFGEIFERLKVKQEIPGYETAEVCKDRVVSLYHRRQIGLRYMGDFLRAWWRGKRSRGEVQETVCHTAEAQDPREEKTVAPVCFDGSEPLVSVIVPCHDVQYYLRACLNSLLRQSMGDLEIIVLDNHSSDGTAEVIAEYAERFFNVRPIYLEKDIGPSGARNLGIERARGKYIAFCDADDSVPEDGYRNLTKTAEKSRADIVVGDFLRVFPDGHEKGDNLEGDNPFAQCLMCGVVWNKLLRRDFVLKYGFRFDTAIMHFEDLLFTARLLQTSPRIAAERSAVYRHLESRGGNGQNGQLTCGVTYRRIWSLVHMLECVYDTPPARYPALWRVFYVNQVRDLYRGLWSSLREVEDIRRGYQLLHDAIAIGERTGLCDWCDPQNHRDFKEIFYVTPVVFKSMTFEAYMTFLAMREAMYAPKDMPLPAYEDPREKTLALYRQGEVGFRYIIKYIKAWFRFKLSGQRKG